MGGDTLVTAVLIIDGDDFPVERSTSTLSEESVCSARLQKTLPGPSELMKYKQFIESGE